MREQSCLGELELMMLLTMLHLGDETYGVPLARELGARRGREVSIGSVYASLERLETKGLVSSKLGEATPERGGRAKRYFKVTEQGIRSLRQTRDALHALWTGLPELGEGTA